MSFSILHVTVFVRFLCGRLVQVNLFDFMNKRIIYTLRDYETVAAVHKLIERF